VIVLLLMTYVVPQVANVFAGTKRALPMLTVLMLALSSFVRSWGLVCSGALAIAFASLRLSLRNPAFRERFDAGLAQAAAGGSPRARLQRGAFRRHAGDAGRRRRADPEGAAGRRRNARQPRDASRCARRAGAGARRRAAGRRRSARRSASPGLLGMFARLGEQTGQLPTMLQRGRPTSSPPKCSGEPCKWRPCWSRC
jgi:general secretion pathway protein F